MEPPNLLRAEEITYSRVQAFDRARAIAFMPVSALEVHGPHLPLGMDLFMARWMAEETARRFAEVHPDWAVVCYPPLTLGTDELPLPGSMSVTQQTLYRALISQGHWLRRAGYGYAVLTNGHGGARHASCLEAACREVSRREGIEMFAPSVAVLYAFGSGQRFDRLGELMGRPLTAEEREHLVGGEHAAGWETSFALAERPEQVEPSYATLGPDGPPRFGPLAALGWPVVALAARRAEPERRRHLEEILDTLARGVGWLANARFGYGGHQVTYQGNPSVASAELGRAFRQAVVDDCLELVEQVTSGKLRAREVRSIASDPAFIQPHFWGRVAAGGAVGALSLLALTRRVRR